MNSPTDPVAFHSEIASDFHDSYSRDANRHERLKVWRAILAKHAPARAGFAYDIGCGSGMVTCEVAARADAVCAIDGSAAMLSIAAKTVSDHGFANVSFREARLPIADTSGMTKADLVVSSSVIEYLDSIEDALRFLKALAKPDGVIVFSVSNRSSLSRKLVRLVHSLTGRPPYFGLLKHFLDQDDIRRLANEVGLEVVEQVYFAGQDRLNRLLATVLPARLSSNMVLAVVRPK
jgi:2-polyprenyl-3-methyl-5-hydroxy-6-metoxy-1,4-benzoquinol methylase